ncbi:MAG: hypothetical protein ACR2PL_13130 [Dehalococcoidia bacterium]
MRRTPTTVSIVGGDAPVPETAVATTEGIHRCSRLLSDIFTARGCLLFRCGNNRAAFKDFTRAIDLDPTNAAALFYRSAVRCPCPQTVNEQRADPDFSLAWQLDPDCHRTNRPVRLESTYRLVSTGDSGQVGEPLAEYPHTPEGFLAAVEHAGRLRREHSLPSDAEGMQRSLTSGFAVLVYECHSHLREVRRLKRSRRKVKTRSS